MVFLGGSMGQGGEGGEELDTFGRVNFLQRTRVNLSWNSRFARSDFFPSLEYVKWGDRDLSFPPSLLLSFFFTGT